MKSNIWQLNAPIQNAEALKESLLSHWKELTTQQKPGSANAQTLEDILYCPVEPGMFKKAQETKNDSIFFLAFVDMLKQYGHSKHIKLSFEDLVRGFPKSLDERAGAYGHIKRICDEQLINQHVEAITEYITRNMRFEGIKFAPNPETQMANINLGCIIESASHFRKLSRYHIDVSTRIQDGLSSSAPDHILAFDEFSDFVNYLGRARIGATLCIIIGESKSESGFAMIFRTPDRISFVTNIEIDSNPLSGASSITKNDCFPNRIIEEMWPQVSGRPNLGLIEVTVSGTRQVKTYQVAGRIIELNKDEYVSLLVLMDRCWLEHYENSSQEFASSYLVCDTPVYEPKGLPSLVYSGPKSASALTESYDAEDGTSIRPNRWMEELFNEQIPDDLVYAPSQQKVINVALLDDGAIIPLENRRDTHYISSKNSAIKHAQLKPATIKISKSKDSLFCGLRQIARYNQAQLLSLLSSKDYQDRKTALMEWWNAALTDNIDSLIKIFSTVGNDEEIIEKRRALAQKNESNLVPGISYPEGKLGVYLKPIFGSTHDIPAIEQELSEPSLPYHLDLINSDSDQYVCYKYRDFEADIILHARPKSVFDIMLMTGIEDIELIPDELKYFGLTLTEKQIDPVWTIKSPWEKLPITFLIPLSIEALKEYRGEK